MYFIETEKDTYFVSVLAQLQSKVVLIYHLVNAAEGRKEVGSWTHGEAWAQILSMPQSETASYHECQQR